MTDEKGKILKFLKLDKLVENITGYFETQIELAKLDLKDQAEKGLQNLFQVIMLMSLMVMIIFFISFGCSIFLNSIFNSDYLGYLLVALVYLILFIIILFDKNKAFGKWVSSRIFKNNE